MDIYSYVLFSACSRRKYCVKKKKSSTVKHGLHYTSAMKSSIRVSEPIYSAKAEKTFLAQSQVPPGILEKHDKFIYVWVLAS